MDEILECISGKELAARCKDRRVAFASEKEALEYLPTLIADIEKLDGYTIVKSTGLLRNGESEPSVCRSSLDELKNTKSLDGYSFIIHSRIKIVYTSNACWYSGPI